MFKVGLCALYGYLILYTLAASVQRMLMNPPPPLVLGNSWNLAS